MMDQSRDHVIQPDFGEARLDALQRHAFAYFLNETNAANGLVADRTQTGAPASIVAVPFRDQPRTGRADVRELPVGFALAADARVPVRCDGTTAGGFHEWLVMTAMEGRPSQP